MPGIEFVTLRRSGYRICLSYIRFLIGRYRFTATIFILVYSEYRPIIYPSHRIQMNHASVSSFILKMNEPGFSCVGVYPATLMRPVDICLSLCHYDLRFVGAVNVLRTKYSFPSNTFTGSEITSVPSAFSSQITTMLFTPLRLPAYACTR